VIVGGKNKGDRYRIKNNMVTMVYRHIHGTVVTIFTESTTDTGSGYLSRTYSSSYSDPETGARQGWHQPIHRHVLPLDSQEPKLMPSGPWVLVERIIDTEHPGSAEGNGRQIFRFQDLEPLS
jgi:hypothetical protein